MLDFLRRHSKSWLMVVAFGFIIVSFIIWGGFRTGEEGQIAEVDGQTISRADYDKFYRDLLDTYRRQFGTALSDDLIRQLGLEKRALQMMIQRYLVMKASSQMGLSATPQEVQKVILEIPFIQTEGKFDRTKYDLFLRQSRRSPEAFEKQLSEDLTLQKAESFIKRRALVTEDEILADYRLNHSQVRVEYVLFNPKSYEEKVDMDAKAVKAFYEQHIDRFRDPEKRQFAIVLFDTDDHLGEVKVTEDQLRLYYDEHPSDYHKEKDVRARHILFSVKEDAPEEEVSKARAEAQKILAEAKSGKDFVELAKKHSQDPTAPQNSGDLGYFERGKMVPAFSDAAFSMNAGDISDLVRTPFGFHIIKVEDVRPEKTSSFDEVRTQIESILKEQEAREIAFKKAREFSDLAYAQKDVEKAAQGRNLSVKGTSSWISKADPLPEMDAVPPAASDKLFGLTEKEISEPIEIPKGFVVVQVKAIQPPQPIPFEKVKDRVEKEFKSEESRKLAHVSAADFLAVAGKAGSLEDAARNQKLEVKKSEWFSRGESDKDLKLLKADAMGKVLQLTESQPLPDAPLELGNRFMVCQLLERKQSDENLEKERDGIAARILQQKQMAVWQIWLSGQERQANIKVFKEL